MSHAQQLRAIRERVSYYISQCARELVEWHDTGILRDGKIREIARDAEPLFSHDSLKVVEGLVDRAALDFVVSRT